MQWKSLFLGAAITAAAFVTANRVFSGDDEPAGDPSDPASAAPGVEHDALKAYVGEWDGSGMFHAPSGDAPVTMSQTGKMILGGRFLQFDTKISVAGQRVQMLEIVGYDPAIKKYVHVSVEDDNSRISRDTGERDAAKKMVLMAGTEDMGGGKEHKYHYTVTEPSAGSFQYTYYLEEMGEKPAMEATLKKK